MTRSAGQATVPAKTSGNRYQRRRAGHRTCPCWVGTVADFIHHLLVFPKALNRRADGGNEKICAGDTFLPESLRRVAFGARQTPLFFYWRRAA
ncbi:MAG: hypothetical protein DRH43_01055 [Deltaproteobacteria bacterium]|nr:MAG: hypothetical protein DRH43_01055 [Deltaproteobacteria bacterium]